MAGTYISYPQSASSGGGGSSGSQTGVAYNVVYSSAVTSAEGATIGSFTLFTQPATATLPGLISSTGQSFSGTKAFSNKMAIGSGLSEALLTVNSNTAFIAPPANTNVHIIGADGAQNRVVIDAHNASVAGGGGIISRRSRGTSLVPTSVLTDDTLGFFGASGYGTTAFSASTQATLSLRASQTWTDTNQGTYFQLNLTANSTTGSVTRLMVGNDGTLMASFYGTSVSQVLTISSGGAFTATATPSVVSLTVGSITMSQSAGGTAHTLQLPTTQGAVGSRLVNNGTGSLSWVASSTSLTNQVSGILPVANGGTATSSQFSRGSVLFAGLNGVYAQDNANLFFNAGSVTFAIGTANPLAVFHVASNDRTFSSWTSATAGIFTRFAAGTLTNNVSSNSTVTNLALSSFGGGTFAFTNGSNSVTNMHNMTSNGVVAGPNMSVDSLYNMRLVAFTCSSGAGSVVSNAYGLAVGAPTGATNTWVAQFTGNDDTCRVIIQETNAGNTSIVNKQPGLELTSVNMVSGAYTPAIKFGSTDTSFTTENPKFPAMILGRATEAYGGDGDGGMALDFITNPNDTGTTASVVVKMTLDQSGFLGVGTTVPTQMLDVVGNARVKSSLIIAASISGTITHTTQTSMSSYTVLWPPVQGAASTCLQNDGSGNLVWAGTISNPISSLTIGSATLNQAAGGSAYTMSLPLTQGSSSATFLRNNGAGGLSWGAVVGSSTSIVVGIQGHGTTGATATMRFSDVPESSSGADISYSAGSSTASVWTVNTNGLYGIDVVLADATTAGGNNWGITYNSGSTSTNIINLDSRCRLAMACTPNNGSINNNFSFLHATKYCVSGDTFRIQDNGGGVTGSSTHARVSVTLISR